MPFRVAGSFLKEEIKKGFGSNIQICMLDSQTDNFVGFMFGIA